MTEEVQEEATGDKTYFVTLYFPLISKTKEEISSVTLRVDGVSTEEEAIQQVLNMAAVKIEDGSLPLDTSAYYVPMNAIRMHVRQAGDSE